MSKFPIVVVALFLTVVSAFGQLRPELTTVAIVGAKVEVRPGVILENATVVVRSGLIVDVGPGVKAPVGADIVDGKGLFVYAGFIDGGTTKGLRKGDSGPKPYEDPDVTQAAPNQMRWGSTSVTAERSAARLYDPSSEAWRTYRKGGFTSVLMMPSGGVVSGMVALVNTDGRPRRDALFLGDIGLAAKTSGRGGQYPGTELGGFAVVRQSLLDAQWYRAQKAFFNAGTAPPAPFDPNLESLQNVLAGAIPVMFEANEDYQVDRVLDLAHEFGLRPIVFGGREAYRVATKLKTFATPVVATLDWKKEPDPQPEKAEGKPEIKPDAKAADKKPVDKPKEPEGESEPKAVVAERERLWLEEAQNTLALTKAGVMVAFSSQGKTSEEFFTNLRRLVKLGLPRDVALAGLTLSPARIWGVERQLGSVEVGKVANLTVLSADFLDPKSKAKWLFIRGIKIDPNANAMKYSNEPMEFDEVGL